jgi:hypothetical protein
VPFLHALVIQAEENIIKPMGIVKLTYFLRSGDAKVLDTDGAEIVRVMEGLT